MQLCFDVPDSIAHSLRLDGPQPARRAVEMLALEGYRAGELSRGQVSQMLGLGFDDTESFLQRHLAMLPYSVEDLEQESANLRQFLAR